MTLRCSSCRHAPHRDRICFNMASDNGCSCAGGQPEPVGTSRFTPDDSSMRESVVAANERAERLALRIVAAEKALKRGRRVESVLRILGGSEDA